MVKAGNSVTTGGGGTSPSVTNRRARHTQRWHRRRPPPAAPPPLQPPSAPGSRWPWEGEGEGWEWSDFGFVLPSMESHREKPEEPYSAGSSHGRRLHQPFLLHSVAGAGRAAVRKAHRRRAADPSPRGEFVGVLSALWRLAYPCRDTNMGALAQELPPGFMIRPAETSGQCPCFATFWELM